MKTRTNSMKHTLMALALCAMPPMAVGQVTTTCAGCTHALSHYMGSGGFIATATEGTKKVTWLSQCGGVTRTGELVPNADGVVSALFSEENGHACMAEKASFELGPIMDGGWFWITDEMNSAVGLLVDKEVHKALKDDAIKIASAGDGVKMTAGMGAVYLKETATGRVGILPNILPKPITPLRKCGYTTGGTAAAPTYSRLTTSCQLGDGGAVLVATIANPVTGTMVRLEKGGAVVRPAGTGVLSMVIDLWGNGSGHFRTIPAPGSPRADAGPRLGHQAVIDVPSDRTAQITARTTQGLQGTFYIPEVGNPPRTSLRSKVGKGWQTEYGIKMTTSGSLTFEIRANETWCSSANNHSLPVNIVATMDLTNVKQITPPIKGPPYPTNSNFVIPDTFEFTIVCPSGSGAASADQGRKPAPGDAFPSD